MPDVERRRCPEGFQERLTRAVGLNRYGKPNFLLAWGQSFMYTAGGIWPKPQGDGYFGYRQLPLSNSSFSGRGMPCWMILEWHPPEDYGTPNLYYFDNRDELTGLQTLGEYPHRGRYEVAYKLSSAEFRNGRMEVQYYQLDGLVLDVLIPCIVEGQKMSLKQRLKRLREAEEKQKQAEEKKIDDLFHSCKRKPLPSQIDDRIRLIQRSMSELLKSYGCIQPGLKVGNIAA